MMLRYDTVNLHNGVDQAAFESFMKDELIPFFSEHYKGPTRVSISDLKGQGLLKDTHNSRHYLWITVWTSGPEAIRGNDFEGTRMAKVEGADAMLAKLATFGSRPEESVFDELLRIEVPTNT
jgi:hypothetical protein